jgi:hypothetical protein
VATAAPGSPHPVGTTAPRPAASGAARPASPGPAPGATGAPAGPPATQPGVTPGTRPGAAATGGPAPTRTGAPLPASSPGGPSATAAPSPGPGSNLNDRLRALLPHNAVVPGHYTPGLDPRTASEEYERKLAPPAEILAATFGLIRISRTVTHAGSIAYVFERKRDLLGREVCRSFRITDHPLPPPPTPPPSLSGGFARPYLPDRPPDLKPIVEVVDVSCNDARMEKVVPGSLRTPVPLHL